LDHGQRYRFFGHKAAQDAGTPLSFDEQDQRRWDVDTPRLMMSGGPANRSSGYLP
jgi:hypothetical protein